MTKSEFKNITAALKAVYTQANFLPDNYSLTTWYGLLADIDYEDAKRAAERYMMSNKFPPTPSDIRALATENKIGITDEWGEAWSKVIKAIKKIGIYQESEALNSFDDITRKAVESMDYKSICNSKNIEVDRAQFRQIYTSIASRQKQSETLPDYLALKTREQIQIQTADRLSLPTQEE